MPVGKGWRRPALAPVYALVTAFAVVMIIAAVTGRPAAAAAPVLRVDAGDGKYMSELVVGASVEVREAGKRMAGGKLSEQGTFGLPEMAGRQVCLQLPAQWHVVEPAMADGCVVPAVQSDLRLAVVRTGLVSVVFEGQQPRSKTVTVTVRNLIDSADFESGQPDASGHYQPRGSLKDQTVCVTPPLDWTVTVPVTVERGGEQCKSEPIADPRDDVEFTLERGQQ